MSLGNDLPGLGPTTPRRLQPNEPCGVIVEMNGLRYHFYDRSRVTFESETQMMQHAIMVYDLTRRKFLKHRFSDKDRANRMLEICRTLGREQVVEICQLFQNSERPGCMPVGIEEYI